MMAEQARERQRQGGREKVVATLPQAGKTRERMRQGGKEKGLSMLINPPIHTQKTLAEMAGVKGDLQANLPDLRQTRDKLGELAGVSGRTMDKVKVIASEADNVTKGRPGRR